MITISIIKINEIEYLTGKVGKKNYSVKYSEELKETLSNASKSYNKATSHAEATGILEAVLTEIKSVKSADTNSLTEVLKGDLSYNEKTNSYHVISGGKTSKEPVHKFFVDKMIEASDKDLSPKPWLVFWVRLMRNELYINSPRKVQTLVDYLNAQYVDEENIEDLMETEGYSEKMARQLSTFDQISITEEGILAAFKYVQLVDKKYIVEKDENGEQVIKMIDRYERKLEVDDITGEVTKDELDLPEAAEEFLFEPPIMGQGGDAFTCKDIDDASDKPAVGHSIKVGKIHELTPGFGQVNTDDSRSGVKGLHLGGHYYVQCFGGKTSYLVDCLVAPEDIGAVCDVARGDDGAIRCRRYMVTGGHFAVSKGMYHPSEYAKLLDTEWEEMKKEVIADLNKAKQIVIDRL